MKAGKPPDAAELRRRGVTPPPRVPPETQRLLHELQVHQIELELQNEELRASRALVEAGLARYTDLYDFSPVGYFTLERDGTILQTNLTGARLLGVERARLAGRRFGAFVAATDLSGFDAFLQRVFTLQPHPACELRLDGEGRRPLIVQVEATLAADGQACHAVVTDITARAQAEVRLQLAASVFTHAREGIIISSPAGTILEVNAAFTRITGYSRDEALGRDPRMLNSGVQGPEFYAAMAMALARDGQWTGEIWNRRKNGEVYAESTTISAVRDADGRTRNYVTLFTDITTMKAHQQQLEHIAHYDALTNLPNRVLLADRLQRAMVQCQRHDRALAVAYLDRDGFKAVNDRHGHNTGDELLITLAHRMKTALREGDTLARIGGDEFVAVLVDLDEVQDCTPVLVRLLPAAFLPVIEDHPISVELGEWVVAAALAQMSAWHAAGQDIPVSVNIGAHLLQQEEFVPQLTALLLAHPDVQHRFLELEVLETSALEDMAHVSEVMHACHALGVRFALDDFGTGYSSLTYLKRLPAELLKIDQSFVLGMIDDADDRAIVEGVIGLVRAFHREVIAEGVETAAHGELLLALGCDLAQGYGIARAMPAAELPAWVASWHRAWPERRCAAH